MAWVPTRYHPNPINTPVLGFQLPPCRRFAAAWRLWWCCPRTPDRSAASPRGQHQCQHHLPTLRPTVPAVAVRGLLDSFGSSLEVSNGQVVEQDLGIRINRSCQRPTGPSGLPSTAPVYPKPGRADLCPPHPTRNRTSQISAPKAARNCERRFSGRCYTLRGPGCDRSPGHWCWFGPARM